MEGDLERAQNLRFLEASVWLQLKLQNMINKTIQLSCQIRKDSKGGVKQIRVPPPVFTGQCSTTELQISRCVLDSYITIILHTTRVNISESIICKLHRTRKMVKL